MCTRVRETRGTKRNTLFENSILFSKVHKYDLKRFYDSIVIQNTEAA